MLNQEQPRESQEADARTGRGVDGGVKARLLCPHRTEGACEVSLWWTTVRSVQVRNDGGIEKQG